MNKSKRPMQSRQRIGERIGNMPRRSNGKITYYALKLFVKHEATSQWELYYTDIFQDVLLKKLKTFQLAEDGTVTIGHMKIHSLMFPSGNIWIVPLRKYEYRNNGQTRNKRAAAFQKLLWTAGIPKIWLWQNWLMELALDGLIPGKEVKQKLLLKIK